MKRLLTAVAVCLLGLSDGVAQTTVRELFKSVPFGMFQLLTDNNRLDLLDYWDSGLKSPVTNQLDGDSKILLLNDSLLQLQLSEALQADIWLLDVAEPADGNSQVVCLLRTYGTDVKSTTIQFFTTDWQELPASRYFAAPDYAFSAKCQLEANLLQLTPVNVDNTPASEEQHEIVQSSILFKWDGNSFKKY